MNDAFRLIIGFRGRTTDYKRSWGPINAFPPILALLFLAACGPGEPPRATPPPDILLTNARVVTMDAADTIAEAVAITGSTITAVGTAAELRALAGPETEIIDLGGNTLSPGIIDTHNHFVWGASTTVGTLDLKYPGVRTIGDVRELLRAAVSDRAPGEWVRGWGWDGAKLEEQRDITAADLDAAVRTIAGSARSMGLEVEGV